MSAGDRVHELIQKHLEGLASNLEIAELERLLVSDPGAADAFAAAFRLHTGLGRYFEKEFRMNEVARLLESEESPAQNGTGRPVSANSAAGEAEHPVPSLVNKNILEVTPRQAFLTKSSKPARRQWFWGAAALVLIALGIGVWIKVAHEKGPRLLSGRVVVAGGEIAHLPEGRPFEVSERAVIELTDGSRIELLPATHARINRGAQGDVIELISGGGEFTASGKGPALRVETSLGVISAGEGAFSLDLMLSPPEHVTSMRPIRLPRLEVAVARGEVTVKQAGILSVLSAGEQKVFFGPTS